MAIELNFSNGEELNFRPGLPDFYNGPLLHGATAVSAKTNIAHVVIQELTCDFYSIRFVFAKFLKTVTGTGTIRLPGLYSCHMLKNGIRKEIDNIGKLHIRQDHYTCFSSERTKCRVRFEKNKEYRSIDFFYGPKLLQELLPYFPELKDVFHSSAKPILTKGALMLPSMKEITTRLLNCPYDETTRLFYFDLKVRELLYQILETNWRRKTSDLNFTPWEAARIHQVPEILEEYISKKPPSLRFLCRQVALNEYKLKKGFKQYFNAGIFDWLMEKKMQHAKHLILTTNKPIKEICAMVGYPLTTNFITAFKRVFGMTPGSLRRK